MKLRVCGLLATAAFAAICVLGSLKGLAQNAYITNLDSNTVSVIDTVTNAVIAIIPVGSAPEGVAVTPDGRKVYVANSAAVGSTVSVIDTATNAVTTITGFSEPIGVAVSPDGSKVYVANILSETVSVIDTATNAVSATIAGFSQPIGVAVTPDGSKVYVTSQNTSTVSVIDTATNAVTATITVDGPSVGVAVTPDGSKVYVTNPNTVTVSVIDTATNAVIATVRVPFSGGVAVTPDGSMVYVTNTSPSDSVSVIDTATNAVIATVGVGNNPFGVAVTPDGSKVYVANSVSDNLSVIDTATNAVIATITDPSFHRPIAFGVFIANPVSPNTCPLTQGFWKTQARLWPVTSLVLGGRTYTEAQLIGFLKTPPTGNAALILADQLIATKLSIANGSDPAPISSAVTAADGELAAVPALPTVVRTNTAAGQAMVATAATLDSYNNDQLTPNCTPFAAP
jgi:YVTN family beta-propeller protein